MRYDNSIIYKIVCNDTKIDFLYIGSTINFRDRKCKHKRDSINSNIKIHTIIRENGGWNNWKMIPIEIFLCKNKLELRIREQFWIDKLNSNLNSNKACNIENLFASKTEPNWRTESNWREQLDW